MKIVYTCPACGADIKRIMYLTDPPRPGLKCTKCAWSWYGDVEFEEIRVPFTPPVPYDWNTSCEPIPECCRNCRNHPVNGGSGFCMCAMPYFSGGGVTC